MSEIVEALKKIYDSPDEPGRWLRAHQLPVDARIKMLEAIKQYAQVSKLEQLLTALSYWDTSFSAYISLQLLKWSAEYLLPNDFALRLCLQYIEDLSDAAMAHDRRHPKWETLAPEYAANDPLAAYANAAKRLQRGVQKRHNEHIVGAQTAIWSNFEMGKVYADDSEFKAKKADAFVAAASAYLESLSQESETP